MWEGRYRMQKFWCCIAQTFPSATKRLVGWLVGWLVGGWVGGWVVGWLVLENNSVLP